MAYNKRIGRDGQEYYHRHENSGGNADVKLLNNK
jgi:hypothetical protein